MIVTQLSDYRKPPRRRLQRRPLASRIPETVENATVAGLCGVLPATVKAWRDARCKPQRRNREKLALVVRLLRQAGGS
jgi:hypothetical protein